MKRRSPSTGSILFLLIPVALLMGFFGCATSSKDDATSAGTGSEFSDAGATASSDASAAAAPKGWTDPGMVHFSFDRSEITEADAPVLKDVASQVNDLGIKIVISGYTDNRGTEEYNLALGERRAAAARSYLVNLGVPADQMTIVSYGELRPLQRGNNEEAWAMNRRAQFAPLQ